MNKLAQMKQLLNKANNELLALLNDEKSTTEDLNNKTAEIEKIEAKIKALEKAENIKNNIDDEVEELEAIKGNGEKKEKEDDEVLKNKLHLKAFAKAISKKTLTPEEAKALSSNTDEDGGYLIPKDLKTKINELMREHISLRDLVTVEPVPTKEGHRILEKDADTTGFTDITELTDLPNLNSPQWTKVDYKIRDLGGLLPIPNSLIEDETGGLLNYLANWFVKKSYATDNNILLFSDGSKGSQGIIGSALEDNTGSNVFKKIVLTTMVTFTKMKSIINKDFKRPIQKKLKIVTNQTGLDILDGMEDKNGRPYLTGDGTEAFPYKFKGKEVVVYDDDTLPNDETDPANILCPFIIGNLKAGMVLFDRKQMSLDSSKEAGFKNNSTIMRGIIRLDCRVWDKTAVEVVYSPIQ